MARACKICELGRRKAHELEQDYINGMNKSNIARKYGVSYDSVCGHIENHLTQKLVKGAELQESQDGFNLMEKIDELHSWTKVIFQRNFDKKRDRMALKALSEQRYTLELLAKISYALHQNKPLF